MIESNNSTTKNIYYSSSTNGFYSSTFNLNIPADAIEITINEYQFLLSEQSAGKYITSDSNGKPVAIEKVLTDDEIELSNKSKQSVFLAEATQKISILQDAIDLDMSEEGTEDKLKEWKKYRVLLSRVDTSLTEIEWPIKPPDHI